MVNVSFSMLTVLLAVKKIPLWDNKDLPWVAVCILLSGASNVKYYMPRPGPVILLTVTVCLQPFITYGVSFWVLHLKSKI